MKRWRSAELARADQEALAAAPGASNDERYELANTVLLMGGLVRPTGKLTEAEVEIRTALRHFRSWPMRTLPSPSSASAWRAATTRSATYWE